MSIEKSFGKKDFHDFKGDQEAKVEACVTKRLRMRFRTNRPKDHADRLGMIDTFRWS